MFVFIVSKHDLPISLIKFISKKFSNSTNSHLQFLIRKKQVRINGIRTNDPKHDLFENDEIVIFDKTLIPVQTEKIIKKENLVSISKIEVIFEDIDLLICWKPHGISVHHEDIKCFDDYVKEYCESRNYDFIAQHAHRLDRETAGLIIYCKNKKSLIDVSKALKDRKDVKKIYTAEVDGNFPENLTSSSGFITKDLNNFNKMIWSKNEINESSQSSLTKFKKVRYFSESNTSELQVEIITGRKHQIRANLSSLGFPISGDQKYGSLVHRNNISLLASEIRLFNKTYRRSK